MSRRALIEFNEAHPPFATSVDALLPSRTDSVIVAQAQISKENFDYVRDPAYLWQDMPTVTPPERERRDATKAAKAAEVDHYVLRREQFWERVERVQFADDMEYEYTITTGIETTHQENESETVTETIGFTLGLELSGNLFSPGGAARAAAYAKAAGMGGGRASSSAQFTYELSNELRFERMDSTTYREEKTISQRTTCLGGNVYYRWALVEELVFLRRRPNVDAYEPVSDMAAATGVTWTDRLTYRAPELARGGLR